MSSAQRSASSEGDETRRFLTGIARGTGGALLFALPIFMTMEMWFLGLYIDRTKLFLLCALNIPLLILLAHRIGFEKTTDWKEACRDAAIAFGLAIIVSTAILILFGILDDQATWSNVIAKVALQAVPASIGALLGRSQLGAHSEDEDEENEGSTETSYVMELFMMMVGALFLNLNVAPTEEMILIGYKITPYHTLLLVILSILIMHGFVYALHFKGTHRHAENGRGWHSLVRFTLPGYVIALAMSAYTLWTFERLGDTSLSQMISAIVILGFPAAIGAASARLIL